MEICVRSSDNVIVQFGDSLGPLDGCTLVTLDDAAAETLMGLYASPNGGVSYEDGTMTALAVPTPPAKPDPLKTYRDALTTAANADPNLTTDTKTALQNLLNAMAPR